MSDKEATAAEVDKLYDRMKRDAAKGGYRLNPDTAFVKELIGGILTNESRFGYSACPCRLAAGEKELDLDIICPCDYRDKDLNEHGACYCALYVSPDVEEGRKALGSIPDRRPSPEARDRQAKAGRDSTVISNSISCGKLSMPVWRCKVCGYLCARDEPPELCPICKAKKDRFEQFI